jgi:hypothetical protein
MHEEAHIVDRSNPAPSLVTASPREQSSHGVALSSGWARKAGPEGPPSDRIESGAARSTNRTVFGAPLLCVNASRNSARVAVRWCREGS